MPEFIMEGRDHAARAESDFVLGFIEAMFFTETGHVDSESWLNADPEERTSDGRLPSDVGYTDLHPDSLEKIRTDCGVWQILNMGILERAYATGYDETQAGRDYWFTRNGHGVGFWDRPELKPHGLGEALTEACRGRDIHVWFADHVTYGDAPFVHVHV